MALGRFRAIDLARPAVHSGLVIPWRAARKDRRHRELPAPSPRYQPGDRQASPRSQTLEPVGPLACPREPCRLRRGVQGARAWSWLRCGGLPVSGFIVVAAWGRLATGGVAPVRGRAVGGGSVGGRSGEGVERGHPGAGGSAREGSI